MLTDRSLKIPKQYKCEKCNYITCNKKDFNKHLLTEKHIILTNVDNNSQKIPDKTFYCGCGKKYKHRQSLSVHKKKCILIIENTGLITIEDKKEILELKEANKELKEDNKELKNMIKELIKENAKQSKIFIVKLNNIA